jgi:hypothetical protein
MDGFTLWRQHLSENWINLNLWSSSLSFASVSIEKQMILMPRKQRSIARESIPFANHICFKQRPQAGQSGIFRHEIHDMLSDHALDMDNGILANFAGQIPRIWNVHMDSIPMRAITLIGATIIMLQQMKSDRSGQNAVVLMTAKRFAKLQDVDG